MRQYLLAVAVAAALGGVSSAAHADGDTTIGGKMFIDFTNLDQTKNGADTSSAGSGLDVKRFYFTVNHKFDDFWSVSLTTDFNYTSSSGETQLFVKKVWVQANFDPLFKVRAGTDDMPWIPFDEGLYSLRYVENTLIDRLHYGTSSDWGFHVFGGDKMWNYNVALVNGGGYKHPQRTDSMDVEGRVSVTPIEGLTFALGGYNGKLGKDTANLPSGSTRTASRWDAIAAYVGNGVRAGAEYFSADNFNNVPTSGPKDSADGYSVWGQYYFAKQWSVFGRYDHAKPSKDLNPSLKDRYYNVGLQWAARKGVTLAFVYKHDKLDDNTGANTKSNEIGVWGQVAF